MGDKRSLQDVVFAIDVSISMKKQVADFIPSKLDAAKEATAIAIDRLLSAPLNRAGLVVFYEHALPLTPLTNDKKMLLRTLGSIDYGLQGSAPGEAVVASTKMLRKSPDSRSKKIVLLTDGDSNAGVRLDAATIYAKNMKATVYFITIGRPNQRGVEVIKAAMERGRCLWLESNSKRDLLSNIIKVVE
ncbi:MAG: VWA domain-containing protein [Desulfurococcales archaeon]|nr:VWA domain-containing protein [Desulfurococcales archaeon]